MPVGPWEDEIKLVTPEHQSSANFRSDNDP
jgi:hypothetical protein